MVLFAPLPSRGGPGHARSGINICSIIELAGVQQFTQTFEVNVFGTIRVTKAFLGAIRRSRGRTRGPPHWTATAGVERSD